jgi:hypothetical protein
MGGFGGGFDVDSIRAHHDDQRAAQARTTVEEPAAPTVRMPVKGDRVRFSIRNRPEVPASDGIVDKFEDRGRTVGVRGLDWEFFRRIDLDSFVPGSDSVFVAEVIA